MVVAVKSIRFEFRNLNRRQITSLSLWCCQTSYLKSKWKQKKNTNTHTHQWWLLPSREISFLFCFVLYFEIFHCNPIHNIPSFHWLESLVHLLLLLLPLLLMINTNRLEMMVRIMIILWNDNDKKFCYYCCCYSRKIFIRKKESFSLDMKKKCNL